MKKTISTILILVLTSLSKFVFAEFWASRTLDSGETIYAAGHYDRLQVGQRGVGFITTQTLHDKQSVTLKIDGLNPMPVDIDLIYPMGNIYLFKNSKEILPLIYKANRVEISFNSCGSAFKSSPMDCLFTAKGEPYSVSWDFEKPLNASFGEIKLNPEAVNSIR